MLYVKEGQQILIAEIEKLSKHAMPSHSFSIVQNKQGSDQQSSVPIYSFIAFNYLLFQPKMGQLFCFQISESFQATYVQKELQRVALSLGYHHPLIDLLV